MRMKERKKNSEIKETETEIQTHRMENGGDH